MISFREKRIHRDDNDILHTKININETTTIQNKSDLASNKSTADVITSEPGYSNIDCVLSSDLTKKLSYDPHELSDNTKNKSMDWIKFGSGVSSFFGNQKTIHCCPCLYCDKYNISKQTDKQTNISTISEHFEEDIKKTTDPKCASKSICCLVFVLFLIFVSAGAILLYQSRK